jgi:hypothetical protein
MKILGWILTILGGMGTVGGLIQIANGGSGFYLPSFLLMLAVFVVGLIILKFQKKK